MTHSTPYPQSLWVILCHFERQNGEKRRGISPYPFETMPPCCTAVCIASVSAQPCAIASSATGSAQARFPFETTSQGRFQFRACKINNNWSLFINLRFFHCAVPITIEGLSKPVFYFLFSAVTSLKASRIHQVCTSAFTLYQQKIVCKKFFEPETDEILCIF